MNLGSFVPHGFCLAWDPGLVFLQAASDILIALAYYAIPAMLLVFLRRRRDLVFRPIFGLFAAFILACGTTHVMGVITLYAPWYWTDGVIKAVTAALSIATAIVLWPLLPKALALPSPAALRDLNAQLAQQIAERDRSTALLRDSEQRQRELYARTPAILHATDAHGILIEVSDRWLDLFGYRRDQVIGRTMKDFYAPGTVHEFAQHLATLLAEPPHTIHDRRIVLATGEIRAAEAVYTLEYAEHGKLRRILVALTDVTLRKQAEAALRESEERLRHAQKMEAVGQLTGGVAHDFNNILTTIMASLELLQRTAQLDARSLRMTGAALESTRRAARLTSQLLSFSRKSRLEPQTLDATATIHGIGELLTQTAGPSIKLRVGHDGAPPWPIFADHNQLESAILNLVINARDAISGDGEIAIFFTNRSVAADDKLAAGPEGIEPGDYVGITVSDTGSGMAPEVLARAFEPFFTTKPLGTGTGLGLSQTYGFATQSGGTITLRSTPGQGTQVTIWLPRSRLAAPQAASRPAITAQQGEGRVILLAEDDVLLCQTVTELLRAQGYTVEAAPDGPSALALLHALARVDLLLTDVLMPGGMTGVDLACAARAARRDLPIMFTTGFSEQGILARWPEVLDVVNKPFELDVLLGRIETALKLPHRPPPLAPSHETALAAGQPIEAARG
jgi:PAS domain S-box-containing protein